MKAPETIYIAVYPNDDGLDTHLGDWYSEPEYHAEDNLEYIRKDTLIEWLEECKNNPVITDLQKGNIQELIDKINSL